MTSTIPLTSSWITSKLRPLLAIASEKELYLLEFIDNPHLQKRVENLCRTVNGVITPGTTTLLKNIEEELHLYFSGSLKQFRTPLFHPGSSFQNKVWNKLRDIPYGETVSYSQIATSIGMPSAKRAVARAIGSNPLAILVPCHRVILSSGGLGGYAGGVENKKYLLLHEKEQKNRGDTDAPSSMP